MKPVVLVGHAHSCPLHGMGSVVTGAAFVSAIGRPAACVGDVTSCGAKIVSGSSEVTIDGKGVAREGDMTDHGGVLTQGYGDWLVG